MASIYVRTFKRLSTLAVRKAVNEDPILSELWAESFVSFPSFHDHFGTVQMDNEEELRIRMLICSQVAFLYKVVSNLQEKKRSYLDIGDSDGSVRILFNRKYPDLISENLGINLQQKAVENMLSKGLKAECIDAMDLHKKSIKYDLVSVFETLEHLPNPIGFLESMSAIVNNRLIISVPLIQHSRVGMGYLHPYWPKSKTPTITTTHIFELNPADLKKIFWHTGWEVDLEWKVRTFPKSGPLNWILKRAWRKISFEGWYFVSLKKNDKYSSQYKIE